MKCRHPSSSSSSCIESQNINGNADEITKRSPQHKKPKRSPAKRTQSSATGSSKSRSSIYRGVTRHRWRGRYEAHLWDKDYTEHCSEQERKTK